MTVDGTQLWSEIASMIARVICNRYWYCLILKLHQMALTGIYIIVSSTSEFMVWAAAFSFRDRGAISKALSAVYCNIRHCCILCATRLYKSIRTKKSSNILRVRFRQSLAIKDLRILVNDPEVTQSCNNGQLVPFLMHSYDYLEIIKDGRMVGKYCGIRAGQNILLSGDQILITFHSDDINQGRGFLIHFTAGPHGKKFS